jgi:hypothetical protein
VTELSWQPRPARAALYAGAAVVAGVLAWLSDGGPLGLGSGLPLTVVAVVLGILAGLDVWFRRGLRAGASGIELSHGPGRVELLPWDEIERIDAGSSRSRGLLRLASLEVDLGERLVVLSRHRLGADPAAVAEQLRAARPNGPPPRETAGRPER